MVKRKSEFEGINICDVGDNLVNIKREWASRYP